MQRLITVSIGEAKAIHKLLKSTEQSKKNTKLIELEQFFDGKFGKVVDLKCIEQAKVNALAQ